MSTGTGPRIVAEPEAASTSDPEAISLPLEASAAAGSSSHAGEFVKLCPFCAEQIQAAAVVCKHCGRELDAQRQAAMFRGAELAMGVGAFFIVGALLFAGVGGAERFPVVGRVASAFLAPTPRPVVAAAPAAEPEPPPPPPPLVISVLDEPSLRLAAGEHLDTAFVVDDELDRPCTFSGRVQGLDGGSRDVEVYLLDEDDLANWHNGIKPTPVYESGRTSAATVELPLPGEGRYHLLVSNRYSVFTSKTVRIADAHVTCEEPSDVQEVLPGASDLE